MSGRAAGPPGISVVLITRNEGPELHLTVENLRDTLPPRSEIVIVDDGSTDGSTARYRRRIAAEGLGVARARNLGAANAKGDMLVFADAHIRLDRGWWQPLAEILQNPRIGAAAPAVTHLPAIEDRGYGLRFTGPDLDARWLRKRPAKAAAVPIVPGCCVALRRKTFLAVRGWDGGLRHRGGTDNEFSIRLWLLGYEAAVVPEVSVRHLFRQASPYPVGWPEYLHNRLRLAFAHLSPSRMAKVVRALHRHEAFGAAMALLVEGGISDRRREMLARRKRTDDEYFERFGMRW
ncbi:MAG TPA: glycosyltransferase [Candidatus Acidoferrales bacterium]|nr:glycosyltransferase [Candidatus Acidoferrales bacterium]